MVDDLFTLGELYAAAALPGAAMVYDVETYPNYFLVSFMDVRTKKICFFERHENTDFITEADYIRWITAKFCLIGFNSKRYDLAMMSAALDVVDPSCGHLKEISNRLIDNEYPETVATDEGFTMLRCNHIDLFDVAPLTGSLKAYAARLHAKLIQDLPYHHAQVLTREEKNIVRSYNINDLSCTLMLLGAVSDQLNLRSVLSNEYGQDLRSKSDAQIAEVVIGAEIKRITGVAVKKPGIVDGWNCRYNVPPYISYMTPALQAMLERVRDATFRASEAGVVQLPTELEGLTVAIGAGRYRMGVGGLHSSEQRQVVRATDDTLIIDRDVASYYPAIILTLGLYPVHMGPVFLDVYRKIVDRRIAAKKAKDVIGAESLKITANGTFGKHGSPYSILYAPELLLQVTLTGQLALLMQIEWVETMADGCRAVSANTDGVTYLVPKASRQWFNEVLAAWEKATGFVTEEGQYRAVYSRDVNNYIAITPEGKPKAKGAYKNPWDNADKQIFRLFNNPDAMICVDAATKFLIDGTPVETTIRACGQMERFVSVRNVKGGGAKDGRYLGKVVRWYYAKGIAGAINYVLSGNKVPKTDNAKPCMLMPDTIPDDLDYNWYVENAICILEDVGALARRHETLDMMNLLD